MLVSNQHKALDESQTAVARRVSGAISEASEVETLKVVLHDCRKRLCRGALGSAWHQSGLDVHGAHMGDSKGGTA